MQIKQHRRHITFVLTIKGSKKYNSQKKAGLDFLKVSRSGADSYFLRYPFLKGL